MREKFSGGLHRHEFLLREIERCRATTVPLDLWCLQAAVKVTSCSLRIVFLLAGGQTNGIYEEACVKRLVG